MPRFCVIYRDMLFPAGEVILLHPPPPTRKLRTTAYLLHTQPPFGGFLHRGNGHNARHFVQCLSSTWLFQNVPGISLIPRHTKHTIIYATFPSKYSSYATIQFYQGL